MTENVQWVKFYFDKWRNDPGLRVCSLAARGLWMELLCTMHNATPYGHLVVNFRPLSERDVVQLVGTSSVKEVKKLLRELRDAGVFSETSDGVIYSRRQVRDHEAREKSRQYGKAGGNPALNRVNPTKQGSRNGAGHLPLKIEIEIEKEKERKIHGELAFAEFWMAYPRRVGKDAAQKAWDKAIRQARPEEIIAGLLRYQFSPEVQYQPHASTWLNEGRWKIEADIPPPFVLTPSPADSNFSPGML